MNNIDISHLTLPEEFNKVTDFYIPEDDPMSGILYPNARSVKNTPEYGDVIQYLLKEAKQKDEGTLEFALELKHNDNRIILRGHSIQSVEGKIFIFRRLPSYIPDIDSLGMPKNIVELLLHKNMNKGGLIIIAGETGQGKSTTAAASIAYRLKHYGSFCLTIEDPVELPLQGFYQNDSDNTKRGVCFQTNVITNISDAIKSSMRCYPSVSNSILFLGETRDSEMASEVLKVAANGHLVITTMHGGDLMTSLKRFLNLATSTPGANQDEVRSILSSVFRLIIHQKIESVINGKRKLVPNVLFSSSGNSSISTRLRSGNLEMLATEIQNQNVQLRKGESIAND